MSTNDEEDKMDVLLEAVGRVRPTERARRPTDTPAGDARHFSHYARSKIKPPRLAHVQKQRFGFEVYSMRTDETIMMDSDKARRARTVKYDTGPIAKTLFFALNEPILHQYMYGCRDNTRGTDCAHCRGKRQPHVRRCQSIEFRWLLQG
jgi:hypothetical protein